MKLKYIYSIIATVIAAIAWVISFYLISKGYDITAGIIQLVSSIVYMATILFIIIK